MSRSAFPEGVDTFQELFDLPFNKVQDATRLTELKSKESLTNDEQNELARLSLELKEYLVTPETWNKFADALNAVEVFFNENVNEYIENKQKIWDAYIHNFQVKGVWKAGTKYGFQNMVTNEKGDLYICLQEHVASTANKPPVNGSNAVWQITSKKGDKGDPSLPLSYKGDWDATTAYVVGDSVTVGRVDDNTPLLYYALKDNTGKDPKTDAENWVLYTNLYVGAELPSGAGIGLHFIQLI